MNNDSAEFDAKSSFVSSFSDMQDALKEHLNNYLCEARVTLILMWPSIQSTPTQPTQPNQTHLHISYTEFNSHSNPKRKQTNKQTNKILGTTH